MRYACENSPAIYACEDLVCTDVTDESVEKQLTVNYFISVTNNYKSDLVVITLMTMNKFGSCNKMPNVGLCKTTSGIDRLRLIFKLDKNYPAHS